MFSPEKRARLRAELLDQASRDGRLSGGAITGSASVGSEDVWSDIDLAFGVTEPALIAPALADWTTRMYDEHGAVDHLDVTSGSWIYRVFLLRDTLQVDLAFAPADDFGARAPTFKLVFGKAETLPRSKPSAVELVGYAWLYALHTRSSIAREKHWQAEYMLSAVRDHVLALACLRHGLPHREGRGMDQLAADVARPLEGALVTRLDRAALSGAFRVAVDGLLREARHVDAALAGRIEPVLEEMVATAIASSHVRPASA